MTASALDIELSKYWPQLTPAQKKLLLDMIKAFMPAPEKISKETYNKELSEAEAEYKAGDHITSEEMLKLIRQW